MYIVCMYVCIHSLHSDADSYSDRTFAINILKKCDGFLRYKNS